MGGAVFAGWPRPAGGAAEAGASPLASAAGAFSGAEDGVPAPLPAAGLSPLIARSASPSSTEEDAAFTSRPAAWSLSRTSLLDSPCSLAISWIRFFAMQSYRFYEVFGNLCRSPQGTAHSAALDRLLGTLGAAHIGAAPGHRRRRVYLDPTCHRNQAQQLGLGTDRPTPDAAPVRYRAYDAGSPA